MYDFSSAWRKTGAIVATVALVFGGFQTLTPQVSYAATTTPNTPTAKISFTFDDNLTSAFTNVAPILQKYGYEATEYAPTGCINDATATSLCAINEANLSGQYMTLAQLQALQNTYGWEIGDHTVNHPLLTTVSASQLVTEIEGSQTTLKSDGFNPVTMATPFGDYNPSVVAEIAKVLQAHRGFADVGYNVFPYNDYLLYDQQVQGGVTPAMVESYIQTAITNKQWLILTFHDVLPNASIDPTQYQYAVSDFQTIVDYVHSLNLPVVRVEDGLAQSTNNLLPNSSFNNGIADGWTTDDPTNIKLNTASMGNYPDPTNSIELDGTGTTKNGHLFSPKVPIDPTQTYVLKNYLNLAQNTGAGTVGFYIDEYDSLGNWISGQYKAGESSTSFVESMNFEYKPSSSLVKQASLQIIVTANSGIRAYVDNVQWFSESDPVGTPTPTPSVTPTSTPTPTPTPTVDLMTNGNFDAGIAQGWTTSDATNITADNGGNGSGKTPATSVKLVSSTANTYLFGPHITVSSPNTYQIDSFLNIKAITTGVVGFYIDEWNSSGTWVSGQYKTDKNAAGSSTVSFTYTPTSTSVATASLQVILVGNSATTAYIDAVDWLQTSGVTPTPTPSTTPTTTPSGTPTPTPSGTPTPTLTPTPTGTNLMPNGDFDSGISLGWTTDNATNIVADNGGNGSGATPATSIKLTALTSTTNIHLFSPHIAVSSTHTYTISSFLNLKAITSGVFAYYIDEYDASGNWVSGKYVTDKNTVTNGTVSFTYTPTSATVASASLQFIVVGNSGTSAYVDAVSWTQN